MECESLIKKGLLLKGKAPLFFFKAYLLFGIADIREVCYQGRR